MQESETVNIVVEFVRIYSDQILIQSCDRSSLK